MSKRVWVFVLLSLSFPWASCLAAPWEDETRRAREFLLQGRYDESQKSLLNALTTCPEASRVGVLMNLANVQHSAGNAEGAHKTLQTALTYADQSPDRSLKPMILNAIARLEGRTAAPPSGPGRTAEQQPGNQAPAAMLQGGVALQDQLGPMDPTLGRGNNFDKDTATALLARPNQRLLWYMVPKAFAGTWLAKQATIVYYKDHRSGRVDRPNQSYDAKSSVTIGSCLDKKGNIWEELRAGYWSVPTEYESRYSVSYVRKCDIARRSDTELIIATEGVTFEIDSQTNKILDSFQYAGLNLERPIADGLIRWEQQRRVYDEAGRVKISSINIANDKRVMPFAAGHVAPEKVKSFHQYLHQEGLDYLIPDSEPQAPVAKPTAKPKPAAAPAKK